jgi:hypothetical protein
MSSSTPAWGEGGSARLDKQGEEDENPNYGVVLSSEPNLVRMADGGDDVHRRLSTLRVLLSQQSAPGTANGPPDPQGLLLLLR